MRHIRLAILLSALTLATPSSPPAAAATSTPSWRRSRGGAAAGISQSVISQALGGVQQDPAVLNFDRRQRGTFNKTFEQYVSTRVGAGRINGGRGDAAASCARCCRASSSSSACRRQILVAIWGLETDFGKGDMGRLPVFRVLATMAHDCRRTELFQGELLAALKIVQRGDLRSAT